MVRNFVKLKKREREKTDEIGIGGDEKKSCIARYVWSKLPRVHKINTNRKGKSKEEKIEQQKITQNGNRLTE